MSDNEQRIKREPPERERPIRNMSGMFRSSADGGNGVAPGAAPRSPAERGVDMGYRVLDEHIQQGRQAAQQRHGGSSGFGRGFTPGPGLLDGFGAGLGRFAETMPGMATGMLRMWIQMMSMWLEMMDPRMLGPDGMREMWTRWSQMMDPVNGPMSWMSGGPANGPWGGSAGGSAGWPAGQNPASRSAGPFSGPAASGAAASHLRVSVTTVSSRPVRVGFDLRPGCEGLALGAQNVRAVEPDKPALEDVRFESDDELRIIVTVTDEQPEGLYAGRIVDQQSGETVGMLSVHVSI